MTLKNTPLFSSAEVFQQAMEQHQLGNLAQAEMLYRQILQHEPTHPDALHFLGVMAYQLGNLPASIELINQALIVSPSLSMYSNLALVFQAQGNFEQLIHTYQQALLLENNPAIHFNLANVFAQQGNLSTAVASYQAAIALNPDDFEVHNSLGNAFVGLGNFQAAIDCYQSVISLKPDYGQVHNNLGNLFKEQGKFDEAVASYQRALTLIPTYARGYHNLAVTLYAQGKLPEAINRYQKSIALEPNHESYYNLGCIFQEQGKLDEAKTSFQQAIALKPDFSQGYHNLGATLQKQGKLDAAIELYEKSRSFNPCSAEVCNDLASALREKGCYQQAITLFRQGLEYDAQHAYLNFNLGLALLGNGDYEEGWRYAEYRYDARIREYHYARPPVAFPKWQGESLVGKSLLIWHEQGFGDEIQFCRYVSVLKRQGVSYITVACKKTLKPLFETLAQVDKLMVVEELSLIQPHDYWTFLLSIPLHCKTTANTIPVSAQYLTATPERINNWKSKLPQAKMRVGLVWKGSVGHSNDVNRSLSHLTQLLPLWAISDCAFVSLQKGQGEDEILALPVNCPVTHLGSQIQDFADTAAIVSQLDLIICVDTSIAHLAGALGKPVWVLLPFAPDWRWLTAGEETAWYPTMRLFRQKQLKQWQPVIAQVSERLKSVITSESL